MLLVSFFFFSNPIPSGCNSCPLASCSSSTVAWTGHFSSMKDYPPSPTISALYYIGSLVFYSCMSCLSTRQQALQNRDKSFYFFCKFKNLAARDTWGTTRSLSYLRHQEKTRIYNSMFTFWFIEF